MNLTFARNVLAAVLFLGLEACSVGTVTASSRVDGLVLMPATGAGGGQAASAAPAPTPARERSGGGGGEVHGRAMTVSYDACRHCGTR